MAERTTLIACVLGVLMWMAVVMLCLTLLVVRYHIDGRWSFAYLILAIIALWQVAETVDR